MSTTKKNEVRVEAEERAPRYSQAWYYSASAACIGMLTPENDVARLKMLLADAIKAVERSIQPNHQVAATQVLVDEAKALLEQTSLNYRIAFNGTTTTHRFSCDREMHRYCEGISDTAAMPVVEREVDGVWQIWSLEDEKFMPWGADTQKFIDEAR